MVTRLRDKKKCGDETLTQNGGERKEHDRGITWSAINPREKPRGGM